MPRYSAFKSTANGIGRYAEHFGLGTSPWRGSPATWEENKAGHFGVFDALNGIGYGR